MPPAALHWVAFAIILAVGAAARLYQWGEIPHWLAYDEMQVAVDAKSILDTGADRWGYRYPVHFPGLGIGIHPLYIYLTVPMVALGDLTVRSIRAVQLLAGLATLPLIYLCARMLFDRTVALVAMALIALLPWHVMLTRWALEPNIVTTVSLLCLVFFALALDAARGWIFKPLALGSLCLLVYGYSATLFVVPVFALLVAVVYWREILARWRGWLGGLAVALALALPELLWLYKNFISRDRLPFEAALPFSVPLFPTVRVNEVGLFSYWVVQSNLRFLLRFFDDRLAWNTTSLFLPLTPFLPVFSMLGGVFVALRPPRRTALLPLLFVLAHGPYFLVAEANVNRVNAMFPAFIILMAVGLVGLYRGLSDTALRRGLLLSVGGLVAVYATVFLKHYFENYNRVEAPPYFFNIGYPQAQARLMALARPDEPIWIATHPRREAALAQLVLDPSLFPEFRRSLIRETRDGVYEIKSFGRFLFGFEPPDDGTKGLLYMARADRPVCEDGEVLERFRYWIIGRCR